MSIQICQYISVCTDLPVQSAGKVLPVQIFCTDMHVCTDMTEQICLYYLFTAIRQIGQQLKKY